MFKPEPRAKLPSSSPWGPETWLSWASLASGAAALVQQTLWQRQLALLLGSGARASSLALAIFMSGLALGSALSRRGARRQGWRDYSVAELALGLGALAGLLSLQSLTPMLLAWPGLLKAAVACLLLLPAATACGATLPFAVEAGLASGWGGSPAFARIYALNTVGAALGALVGAFALVPLLGTPGSAALAAGVNLFIGWRAWQRRGSPAEPRSPDIVEPRQGILPSQVSLLAFLSGLATFVLEVLWARSLTLTFGSSTYAFAAILAAVLGGLALGALAWQRWGGRFETRRLLAGGYALAAVATLGSALLLGRLPEIYFSFLRMVHPSFGLCLSFAVLSSLLCLLTVSFPLGALFPALERMASAERSSSRHSVAALYLGNTVGAVIGALLAGFVLVPRFGLQALYVPCAAILLACSVLSLLASRPRWIGTALGAGILALGTLAAPHFHPWDPLIVTSGVFQGGLALAAKLPKELGFGEALAQLNEIRSYREGSQAVVAVRDNKIDGERSLIINGKVDASYRGDGLTQTLLAHVPLLSHSAPKRAFIIGWGSGCTVGSAAAHGLEAIDCAEIEPAVFNTAPFFRGINSWKWDPAASSRHPVWEDPRVRVNFVDARAELTRQGPAYDVIISEPSNPWIAGIANLYTLDFYQAAQRRLAPGGIYCQWFHYYGMDEATLKLQFRTFAAAFPHASVWTVPQSSPYSISGDLLLLGSLSAMPEAPPWLAGRLAGAVGLDLAAAEAGHTASEGALPAPKDALWLASLQLLGDAQLRAYAGAGPLNTDRQPRLEFQAPRSLFRVVAEHSSSNLALYNSMASHASPPAWALRAPPETVARLAGLYSERSLHSLCLALLSQATPAAQSLWQSQLALARSLLFSGRSTQAVEPLARAFKASSQAREEYHRGAEFFGQKGRWDVARSLYAVAADAGDRSAVVKRDEAALKMGAR